MFFYHYKEEKTLIFFINIFYINIFLHNIRYGFTKSKKINLMMIADMRGLKVKENIKKRLIIQDIKEKC